MVVSAAEGRYIVWVDGDMIIPDYFISKLFSFIEMNPKIGIVKGTQTLKPGGNVVATLEAYSRVAGKMVNYKSIVKQYLRFWGLADALSYKSYQNGRRF